MVVSFVINITYFYTNIVRKVYRKLKKIYYPPYIKSVILLFLCCGKGMKNHCNKAEL
jgi:hypothetical protein